MECVLFEAGKIDILINNAGISLVGPVENTLIPEAVSVFDTNVLRPVTYLGCARTVSAGWAILVASMKEATMAVEWTITIEGKNEFGDICRKEVRIDNRWEQLFDGDLGLSIEDGKKIMEALQNAVVNHEAETYSLYRRVCPHCHTFRAVKDYTTRRIRTVFGMVRVRNPRWMLCSECYPGMVVPSRR